MKKSTYKNIIKFECWRKKCPARINYFLDGTCVFTKENVPHHHCHEEEKYKELCVLNDINEEIVYILRTLGGQPNAMSSVKAELRNISQK